jgi:O-antigen/teichoic acid export membrane protein
LGDKDAGPYYVALQVVTVASFGINAVNSILAPMISEFYAKNDYVLLRHILRKAAWINVITALALVFALIFFAPRLLSLFGKGFGDAFWPMAILLVGEFVNAFFGPVGFMMTMTGHERTALKVFAVGATVNLGLGLALIPIYGVNGAAFSGLVGTVVWNAIAFLFVRKRLGMNTTIFGGAA